MSYQELTNHLQKREFSPAYFFTGSEDYLIEDSLKKLLEIIVDPSTKEFNLDIFYGNEVDGGKIIDAANAYPMLSDARAVVVKDLNRLSVASLELLEKYLDKPAPTTRLILISEKADFRNKVLSKIKAKSFFVEFKPVYDNKIPAWIQGYLRERDLTITSGASLLIQAQVGNNLRAIVNELNKIILNLGEKSRIDESDVQDVIGFSRKFSVFDLTDAIGGKKLDTALMILNKMLEGGESPTGILVMMSRHFTNLLKIKGALSQNKNKNEISALTGIPIFFVDKSKAMAANFSTQQFEHIFEYLMQTDLILKTSKQPPKIALQSLLIQILREKNVTLGDVKE